MTIYTARLPKSGPWLAKEAWHGILQVSKIPVYRHTLFAAIVTNITTGFRCTRRQSSEMQPEVDMALDKLDTSVVWISIFYGHLTQTLQGRTTLVAICVNRQKEFLENMIIKWPTVVLMPKIWNLQSRIIFSSRIECCPVPSWNMTRSTLKRGSKSWVWVSEVKKLKLL